VYGMRVLADMHQYMQVAAVVVAGTWRQQVAVSSGMAGASSSRQRRPAVQQVQAACAEAGKTRRREKVQAGGGIQVTGSGGSALQNPAGSGAQAASSAW